MLLQIIKVNPITNLGDVNLKEDQHNEMILRAHLPETKK